MTQPPNRVLVLGGKQVGKKRVLRAVTGGVSAFEPTSVPHVVRVAWPVSTKYYDAVIEFLVVPTDRVDVREHTALVEDCQGVIMVYDSQDEQSFQDMSQYADVLLELNPGVMLCLGTEKTVEAAHLLPVIERHNRSLEWAADHGVEYVPMPFLASDISQTEAKRQRGGMLSEDEATGIARVVEALHSNVWQHLQLKGQGVDLHAQTVRPDAQAGFTSTASDFNIVPVYSDTVTEDDTGDGLEAGRLTSNVNVPADTASGPAAPATGLSVDNLLGRAMDMPPDDMDEFTQLADRIRAVRLAAQSAGTEDGRRRAAAEQAILALMDMFKDMDDESTDEIYDNADEF